jgi:hypothetical protein
MAAVDHNFKTLNVAISYRNFKHIIQENYTLMYRPGLTGHIKETQYIRTDRA